MTKSRKLPTRNRRQHYDIPADWQLPLSTINDNTDTQPITQLYTLAQLEAVLANPTRRGHIPAAAYRDGTVSTEKWRKLKDGPAHIPGVFSGRREDVNVAAATAVVLDIDQGNITRDAIMAALDGVFALVHTTYSHTPDAPRWRIIIPLLEPVEWPDTHNKAWWVRILAYWAKRLPVDSSCNNCSHLFYFPSCPHPDRDHYQWFTVPGELFDAKQVTATVTALPKREIPVGERSDAIWNAVSRCYHEGRQPEEAVDYLMDETEPVGAKAREKGLTWARAEVARIYAKVERPTYGIENDRLIRYKYGKGKISDRIALTNFTAEIGHITTCIAADGEWKEYVVRGRCQGRALPELRMTVSQFESLRWVHERWDDVIMYPIRSQLDYVKQAIRAVSYPTKSVQHQESGWYRDATAGWVYRYHGGALGKTGAVPIDSVLDGAMAAVRLPTAGQGRALHQGLRTVLRLLDVLPPNVSASLLLAPFRASLAEFLPLDFSYWLHGTPGIRKTSIALVLQCFFGSALWDKPLGNWSSTDNALEKLTHTTKDMLCVIDDFKLTGSSQQQKHQYAKADRVLRGAANQSGRGRLNADSTSHVVYQNRGLIMGTGELLTAGESLQNRLWTLTWDHKAVDLAVLSELQAAGRDGVLAGVMAAFVQWLAQQPEEVLAGLPEDSLAAHRPLSDALTNTRMPGMMAQLTVTAALLDAFAHTVDVAFPVDAVVAAVEQQGTEQETMRDASPADQFLDVILSKLASGKAHLADADHPDRSLTDTLLGWRKIGDRWLPAGPRIGWLRKQHVLLLPPACYDLVKSTIPLNDRTLWKRLKEAGMLRGTKADRCQSDAMIDERRLQVLRLAKETLFK